MAGEGGYVWEVSQWGARGRANLLVCMLNKWHTTPFASQLPSCMCSNSGQPPVDKERPGHAKASGVHSRWQLPPTGLMKIVIDRAYMRVYWQYDTPSGH